MKLRFDLDNIEKTAVELLRSFPDTRIFAFYGEMGAGKTTFIKAMCHQAGVEEIITSPTFSIVNEYRSKNNGGKIFFHFDFFRIGALEEVMDMGYEDYFYSNSMCFIEWPEKIAGLLPEGTLRLKIEVLETGERQLRTL